MVSAPPLSALIIIMSFFFLSCCSAIRSSVDRLCVIYIQSRITRNPEVQLAFHGKKALMPIVVFSIFSERLDQFG